MDAKTKMLNKCIHFNGIINKECKAGVNYQSVADQTQRPLIFPCIKNGGHCPKKKLPTEEEVDKKLKEIEETEAVVLNAYLEIKKEYNISGKTSGKHPCSCGGNINYRIVEGNGHVWAKCDSCKIMFIE